MQYTKFIENTIRPRERRVANLLNLLLEHYMYDSREMPDMEIVIVDEHISDIEERTNTVTKQIATGVLTINEAREELGLEKFEIEEADKPLITRSLTLLEDAGLDNISISPFEK